MGICGSTLNKKEKESSKLSPQSSPNELPENRTSDLDFPDVHSFDEPHPNKQLLEDLFNKHENPMLLINTSGTQIIAMNHAAMKKIGMFSIEDVFKKCLSSSQERPVTYHDFFNMLGRNREMAMDEEQQFPLHFPVEGASVEVLTSLRVSKLSSGFNVELMETRALVKRLERTIEHHRTLAHEGRNARSAAIAHLRLSQDHLSELHGTLDVRPSSPHRALRAQELLRKAAIEQELSLASEHYVAFV